MKFRSFSVLVVVAAATLLLDHSDMRLLSGGLMFHTIRIPRLSRLAMGR